MSKIFEEAIADVKKLREVAEKNAKKAIIDSVTPRIRDYVEQKIFQNEKTNDSNNVVLENKDIAALANLVANNKIDKVLFEKAFDNLDENQKQKFISITNKINENKKTFNSSKINNKENTQRGKTMSEKFYEIDLKLLREAVQDEAEAHKMAEMYANEDEMKPEGANHDLMAELDELKAEMDEGDIADEADRMMYEQDEDDSEEESEEEESEEEGAEGAGGDMLSREDVEAAVSDLIAELDLEIGGGGAAAGAEEPAELDVDLGDLGLDAPGGEEGEEPEAMNEVFDVDPRMLRQEIARVKAMLTEGNVDHHFGGKGDGKAGVAGSYGGKGPKKHGYQKSFGGGSYGKDAFVNPPSTLKKLNEAKKMLQKLSRENRAQNEKLNQYRSAVKTLREQLEDLNLFNAKLLYVNKLLQNKTLNESQKRSVIKALDEAKSLGETKSLYKSLTESLGRSTTDSKMLSESTRFGSSSRSTRSSAPAGKAESAADISRWQKLAGLK